MAEYVHKDGHREVTVDGSVRDCELAGKAADGRTSWQLAGSADAAPQDSQPDPELED